MTDTEAEAPVKIPRYARFQNQTVRVLYYDGDGYFRVLMGNDSKRTVHRDLLIFIR